MKVILRARGGGGGGGGCGPCTSQPSRTPGMEVSLDLTNAVAQYQHSACCSTGLYTVVLPFVGRVFPYLPEVCRSCPGVTPVKSV